MKIELKSVKIIDELSEETTCFFADVFINGKKAAYAKNDGHGGCTFYHAYENQHELVAEAEKFCKQLPKQKINFGDRVHEFEQSLESVIDDLVVEKGKEKEQKKIDKLCETQIVFGVPNGMTYRYVGFKGKPKLSDVKKTPQGRLALENLINRIKKELREGEVIFNTNLGF
jgi:hypothetical protein